MAKLSSDKDQNASTAPQDGRLDAPAFHRNAGVITAEILNLVKGRRGDALEIGSGTGQHVLAFARALPDITWWPSDTNTGRLISIEAWRRGAGLANLRPAFQLDVTENPWAPVPRGVPLDTGLDAVIAINVVHIAPWQAAVGIFRGAGECLGAGGHLLLYGPFKRQGAHTAPSNAAFDADLRARDPAWGVRDLDDLTACALDHGLTLASTRAVPANNMILVFDKSP